MIKIDTGKLNGQIVARRCFWLAWQACGGPMGMGVLQDRDGVDEAQVWQNVLNAGDYPGQHWKAPGEAYGDYVFGRMMKLCIKYGPDSVEIFDDKPSPAYQSWCGRYRTYQDLVEWAMKSLQVPA